MPCPHTGAVILKSTINSTNLTWVRLNITRTLKVLRDAGQKCHKLSGRDTKRFSLRRLGWAELEKIRPFDSWNAALSRYLTHSETSAKPNSPDTGTGCRWVLGFPHFWWFQASGVENHLCCEVFSKSCSTRRMPYTHSALIPYVMNWFLISNSRYIIKND